MAKSYLKFCLSDEISPNLVTLTGSNQAKVKVQAYFAKSGADGGVIRFRRILVPRYPQIMELMSLMLYN